MDQQKTEIEAAQELVETARQQFSTGAFSAAKESFQKAIELHAENSDAWNGLASALCEINQGEWSEEAVDCLMKSIKADSRNIKAWNNLADFYNRRGETDQAVIYLEKCITLDTENFMAHGNLGLAYRNLERFEEAVDSFLKALSLNNRCGWSGYQLGFTYLLRGVANENTQDLERARQVFQWLKDNLATLESKPAVNEIRMIESYLTMKLNSAAVRVLISREVPEEVPAFVSRTEQVGAIN